MHPTHTSGDPQPEIFAYEDFRRLASDESVVAIGECGLDYFRVDKELKGKEEEVFLEHRTTRE